MTLAVATGNHELENFASVARKSAEEFAAAWEQDAAGALISFIEGLSDTDYHLRGTAELLDEIGIREVRLSDALRRAAGAGDLLRNSIEMSNRAWEENIALAREAEILYETTASQQQLLTNATNELRIAVGDSLTPALREVTSTATDATLAMADFAENNAVVVQGFTVLMTTLGVGIGLLGTYTAAVKILTVAKGALATAFMGVNASGAGFLAMLTPKGKIVLGVISAITALTAALSANAVMTGNRNAAEAESIRLEEEARRATEERSQSHRDATNTLEQYIAAIDDLNTRRVNVQGEQESLAINEELLSIQESIRSTIGAQARYLDLVNGRYEEQADTLREIVQLRRRIELEDARTAMLIAVDSTPTFSDWDIDWDVLTSQLRTAGLRQGIGRLSFGRLSVDDQIERLEEWREALSDARIAGEDTARALGMVDTRLQYMTGTIDSHSAQVENTIRVFDRLTVSALQLEFPNIADYLFDPAQAEQSIQEYSDTIINKLTATWDDIQHIFAGRADSPFEAALSLGLNIDVQGTIAEIERILPGLGREISNALEQIDIDFILNLNDDGLQRFNRALDDTRAAGKGVADAVAMVRKELVEVARNNFVAEMQREMADNAVQLTILTNNWHNAQSDLEREFAYSQIQNHLRDWLNAIQNINDDKIRSEAFIKFEQHAQRAADAVRTLADVKADFNGVVNDATSEIGSLNNVIQNLTDNQSMSVDEIVHLIMQYPKLTRYIRQNADGYYIEIDALEALRQMRIEESTTALNTQVETSRSVLSETAARIEGMNLEISAINDLASARQQASRLSTASIPDSLGFEDARRISLASGLPFEYATPEDFENSRRQQREIQEQIISFGNLLEQRNAVLELLNSPNLGTGSSGRGGSSTTQRVNFNEIWQQEFGHKQFMFDMGTLDATSYWDGFRQLNDQLLEQFGDEYLQQWRQNTVRWQNGVLSANNEKFQRERTQLENELAARVITWEEYYEGLENLRERFYGESSPFGHLTEVMQRNSELALSNITDSFNASIREMQEELRVLDFY